eukprot:TRINITY_DN28351_c0_g1_i1.p1 TRINITY_DN28351_c0_g1~~TRINITY_DN28351_c0_g1_i1.p1  ORF type:complete len:786 (+),score=157.52 TRINITY_DN28351_c0_g1_i1:229-2586(+)
MKGLGSGLAAGMQRQGGGDNGGTYAGHAAMAAAGYAFLAAWQNCALSSMPASRVVPELHLPQRVAPSWLSSAPERRRKSFSSPALHSAVAAVLPRNSSARIQVEALAGRASALRKQLQPALEVAEAMVSNATDDVASILKTMRRTNDTLSPSQRATIADEIWELKKQEEEIASSESTTQPKPVSLPGEKDLQTSGEPAALSTEDPGTSTRADTGVGVSNGFLDASAASGPGRKDDDAEDAARREAAAAQQVEDVLSHALRGVAKLQGQQSKTIETSLNASNNALLAVLNAPSASMLPVNASSEKTPLAQPGQATEKATTGALRTDEVAQGNTTTIGPNATDKIVVPRTWRRSTYSRLRKTKDAKSKAKATERETPLPLGSPRARNTSSSTLDPAVDVETRRLNPWSRLSSPRRQLTNQKRPRDSGRKSPPAKNTYETSSASVLAVGTLLVGLLWTWERTKLMEFSIPYLILYNLVCMRLPDFLGPMLIQVVGDVQRYKSPASAATALSFAYMMSMQAYLYIMRWVCLNMSCTSLFPRFYFVVQMYYYLFWYMMIMVVSPGGVEDPSFWLMVAVLNGTSILSNIGAASYVLTLIRWIPHSPERPLQILFDSKLAVQDQLADVVSLLIVPAIATAFQVSAMLTATLSKKPHEGISAAASLSTAHMSVILSLWKRFGALLAARLISGLLTEEFFRRRVELLHKADVMELELLPLPMQQSSNGDGTAVQSTNHVRYMNDICVGPKLALESMRNIERCEFYFAAVAVICTYSVFQHGNQPSRFAFISFGA